MSHPGEGAGLPGGRLPRHSAEALLRVSAVPSAPLTHDEDACSASLPGSSGEHRARQNQGSSRASEGQTGGHFLNLSPPGACPLLR